MNAELKKLIDELSSGGRISDLLPKAILIAKRLNQREFEKWLKLELHGYYDTNPEMAEEDEVPKYRTVAGLYYDIYGRPLIVGDPKDSFINETRLRNSISEIEGLHAKADGFVKIVNHNASHLLRKYFNIDVQYFNFPSASLKNILDRVRMETIEKLVSLEMEANQIIPKNKKEFKSKLNTLVIENKLKEALEIAAWEAQGDGNVEKEITLQKARVNELERQERLGISKPEDVEVQRIRIRAAILELGDHLLNKDEI